MEEKSDIAKAIDSDENFRSKKRVVVILSIILLALVFTGAEIKEANTLIFKIDFKNQSGLGWFMFSAIIVSLLRYNNYARPYKDQLYSLWSNRLLGRPEIYYVHPVIDEPEGYEIELFPKDYEYFLKKDHAEIYTAYVCRFPFRRYFEYEYGENMCENLERVSLWSNKKIYFHVLWLEFKERIKTLTGHREFLDVYSPYFLASTAIFLFIIKDKIALLF